MCSFAEMHYNIESWLRKKFLTQSMEAYEFGVVLGLAPTEAGLKRKATGIIVLIKQMMKILYCKNKSKSTKITIDMNCLVCL